MNNYFVYHLHTELSLQDSCTNHKLYANKAVELGQKAICYSEHGNIYNWIEKKLYANKVGLKYIHGCEVYLTEKLYWPPDDTHTKQYKIRDNYHTILIAKNYEGLKELNVLIGNATDEDHKYYNPRITFDEFFSISDNIIKISACLASPLRNYNRKENYDKAIYDKLAQTYDYYEIQPHINNDQIQYNRYLYELSLKTGKPLILGTDTHSLNEYKAECRKVLKRAKKMKWDDEDTFDLTYKSYDELVEMMRKQDSLPEAVFLQAIENTNVVESMCEDFELDVSFKYPILYDNEEDVLKARISRMYHEKLKNGIIHNNPEYKERIKEELRVFKKINMIGFMLFMSELVCWCWDNGIPVGPCRGSVGGSMIAYITDIIDVNPIVWDTIFSRFANESRTEIGDIDLDICPSQRQLVYNHIIDKFGQDKTGYILAIGTISDKGTIDEIGRGLSYIWNDEHPNQEKDNPYSLNVVAEIKHAYENNPEEARKKYPELFYYFDGLLNTAISQSMHPAGIVVSPVTLPDNYGEFWSDGKRIMYINMEEIHEISLVKYDILG